MKYTFIGIMVILFTSCGVDHTDFNGIWIDKEHEKDKIIIKKNGDNYIVEVRGKKYPAQIQDGLLEINTELPIKATIDLNDNLIMAGKEYIRYENSDYRKYIGKWKTEDCIGCDELIISEDVENKSFTISYGTDNFYMMDVEQSNFLNIDQVSYQLKEIKARESYGNTDFNFRERYYIKLKISDDGKTLNYSCDDKDNPWPYRTYIKL